MDSEVWHYLKGGKTCRQPRRHIFLDTEARTRKMGKDHVQTWRCGVAIFRHAPKRGNHKEEMRAYTDRETLWTDVTSFVPKQGRAVLWTHNLGYDVRTSDTFHALSERGWKLVGWNIAPQGTWLVWSQGKRTLTMVDSASVFPTTITQLSKMFGRDKLPLPSNVDSMDQWMARCTSDALILRDAIVAYLAWIEREQLGDWQMTGTGQAFAAFRHRFMTHKMLVHWDEDARAMERRAMWTGRTEAYWHGTTHHTQVDEWDLSNAYACIALHDAVPVELVRPLATQQEFEQWLGREGYAVLAEVEITTAVPIVPAASNGRILWPVGRFTTALWSPELLHASEKADRLRFVGGYVYKVEPALSAWSEWILSIVDSPDDGFPAWVRLLARHWGRALIGRLAMRHQTWEYLGDAPRWALRWWDQLDTDTGATGELVQVGRQLWASTGEVDWHNSMTAVTGYVMSRCREIMTRLWLAMPERTALYMDTDSLLVPHVDYRSVPVTMASQMGQRLRLKRSWDRVAIHGPRQLVTGRQVRVSGIPVKAQPLPDGSMAGEVWESLRGALRHGRPDRVRIVQRRWKLRAIDARRVSTPDGWTEPVHLPREG